MTSAQDKPHDGIDSGECVQGQDLALGTNGKPLWLSEKEVMARVKHRVPVETPGLFHGYRKGTVKLEILINAEGQIQCARIVEGFPIAMQAVLDSLKEWRFDPYKVKWKPKAVLGMIAVEYEVGRPRT